MPKEKVKEPDRVLVCGKPDFHRCDNQVKTARYTLVTFLPVAVLEQFRRFANLYFLIIGIIMAIGYYFPSVYESAISPWTTLGPLAFVVSVSLLVEGTADLKRHRNDNETNNSPVVVLKRTDEFVMEAGAERDPQILGGRDVVVNINKAFYLGATAVPGIGGTPASTVATTPAAASEAENVRVAFQKVRRMDIRQGHFVLVKNREMVPADMVLLASSNDQGSAYIETSSIDGETNLKLRNSPHLPKEVLRALRATGGGSSKVISRLDAVPERLLEADGSALGLDEEAQEAEVQEEEDVEEDSEPEFESIEMAVKRLTRFSYLGRPAGKSALLHPQYQPQSGTSEGGGIGATPSDSRSFRRSSLLVKVKNAFSSSYNVVQRVATPSDPLNHGPAPGVVDDGRYVAALTSEPPNPSVHTFSGKLTLPPFEEGGSCFDIALDAENVLLRGAVIRNTEWVIGIAFFTGNDTKLVQNSYKTKSKFSQFDVLLNKTVVAILVIMFLLLCWLASMAVTTTNQRFDSLFYVGYHRNPNEPWPYLPNLDTPKWKTSTQNWFQYFFMYITLLSNFVPLSLYVTVEIITFAMVALVNVDVDMYDDVTNTRAVARSNIITDLGRIQYIFSDKTGTLTQNVMRFKRCSVDGLMFGAPIVKSRPGEEINDGGARTASSAEAGGRKEAGADGDGGSAAANEDDEDEPVPFFPLRQLLVGQFRAPARNNTPGLEGLGGTISDTDAAAAYSSGRLLTFNSEMFLRAMSLCHTVVVEKDIDKKTTIDSGMSVGSASSKKSFRQTFFGSRPRAGTGDSFGSRQRAGTGESLPPVSEHEAIDFGGVVPGSTSANRDRAASQGSITPSAGGGSAVAIGGPLGASTKSPDGAPGGYAYQAESPDEGALVSAASKTFGFQVVSRDSSGIRLRLGSPSHLQSTRVTDGLKSGKITLKHLAAETAGEMKTDISVASSLELDETTEKKEREEVWSILAVNKFDSDRKRMSILLRSPPELGGVPILFCKGADSSMLDPAVCQSTQLLSADGSPPIASLTTVSEPTTSTSNLDDSVDEDGWEKAQVLGLQAHLGDFAKEGLRTLVLGMRVLGEDECTEWLEEYKAAATSMTQRAELLTKVATKIESQLHICGATAIEDKLQKNVPDTIATLAKAGIKLWVLTGDKRETAVEIGYSTRVLTPKMHLTEVPDNGKAYVCTQMAMEFIRLVKLGRLHQYQKSELDDTGRPTLRQKRQRCLFALSKWWKALRYSLGSFFSAFLLLFGCKERASARREDIKIAREAEARRVSDVEMRRRVRVFAEKLIKEWLESDQGQRHQRTKAGDGDDEISLASGETPAVFNRSESAKAMLKELKSKGNLSQSQLREISLAALTVNQAGDAAPLVDEDALSLDSFLPGANDDFDRRKRTILERLFANDRDVRKGHLRKHVKKGLIASEAAEQAMSPSQRLSPPSNGPRALVIEGAALKHLLGHPELEAILFAVASNCDAVIACRSSPRQKAELLNLVRHNVKPEPITLAIGDGANDVGMIQEAHVGVGISGKEGKQAVNASDFAIAQFRFLETLILIHGRWNFYRLTTVAYFSFYKNALMAGILICYAPTALYSGTPLYDQWLIAMLNFVAGIPIIVLGFFDRFLSKEYIRKHPEVYKATRNNELITLRSLARWIGLVLIHIVTLYYFTVPTQKLGGGMTSAWTGLMRGKPLDSPGNGEGGDLKSVGTVTYTCMIVLLAYKVIVESRSLVHGIWPALTCRKDKGEGFVHRLAYTWHGVAWFSLGFYLFAIYVYGAFGVTMGPSQFSAFTDIPYHILSTRSLNWMLMVFVPIMGTGIDVVGKVFANMYFPTQSQIHLEMESQIKASRNRRRLLRRSSWKREQQEIEDEEEESRRQQQQELAEP